MKRALGAAWIATLAACSVESVRPPELPAVGTYTATPIQIPATGGEEQRLVAGGDIPAQWWTLYRSPSIDRLVRDALEASPTLAKAAAKLRTAQESLGSRQSAEGLKVDGKLSANRVDVQPEALGITQLPVPMPLNLYLASVSVSYTFDFFGAIRSDLDALRAAVDVERYELEAARQILAGNVVTAAIREASLREQIDATERAIELQSRSLAIVEKLEQAGGVAHADVVARREELARARAALPDLRKDLEQVRHRLAVYTGRPPGASGIAEIRLAELTLPAELPVSLPSSLVRQRPDLLAAEAMLREAGARVGVATANLYPQITLSANLGSLATTGNNLFSGGSAFYLLGGSLVQPIFRGEELQGKQRVAVATYDQAAAAYRESVLRAFQNVADTLRALEADAAKVAERGAVMNEAQAYEKIAASRHAAGGLSELSLLEARRRAHVARVEQVRALADRHADSAALFQAVGGGWWNEAR